MVDAPVPEPAGGQLLVRVAAAGINRVDVEAARSGPWKRTLGWEAAGVVAVAGPGTHTFRPGDAVIGWTYWFSSGRGTQAEYVVLDASETAAAPVSVDAGEAATLPLNGATAWQALARTGAEPGESLLVIGAAGAIGGFAIDLATARGMTVWGVAAPTDAEFVGGRGAHFIGRGDTAVDQVRAACPSGVDAVLATAWVDQAWRAVLRPGGRFVSTVGQTLPGIDNEFLNAHPDAGELAELACLVDRGALRLRPADRFPLDQAATAYALADAPGKRGRVVLTP
ncbi:NADP-dependent oxidoreductase [Streptomyces sp. NPDC007084]|uniref:NADP-dependent oxidoreductase n=1 Tax=Streptomyces sp. NPDC007084 TaxID=3154313 RepID=UPI0034550BF0